MSPQTPRSLPRFSARRSAAFGANGFPSAARNRFDSVRERVATDSAATVLSASRNTADRTNAASGNPASAAARSIRSRSLVDRRRSRRAVAVIEQLQLEGCTVLYRTACIVLDEYVVELSQMQPAHAGPDVKRGSPLRTGKFNTVKTDP